MTHNFPGSAAYWQQRYFKGGNSGAGSYGNLAKFKASIINQFIKTNNICSVIEWGCGDGNQLSLAKYNSYVGVDVSPEAIKLCEKKFENDNSKKFYVSGEVSILPEGNYDLSLSLDVIFHLIEDVKFENYMTNLFSSSNKFVIIYSSNNDKLLDPAVHVRHRKFTNWINKNAKSWSLKKKIKNKYPWNPNSKELTSFSDFYIYQKLESQ